MFSGRSLSSRTQLTFDPGTAIFLSSERVPLGSKKSSPVSSCSEASGVAAGGPRPGPRRPVQERPATRPGESEPFAGFSSVGTGEDVPSEGLRAGAGSPQRLGACTVDVGGGTEAACQGRGSTPRCACSAATRPFGPDGDTVSLLQQTVAKCAGRRAYRLRRCPRPARGRSAHSLGRAAVTAARRPLRNVFPNRRPAPFSTQAWPAGTALLRPSLCT